MGFEEPKNPKWPTKEELEKMRAEEEASYRKSFENTGRIEDGWVVSTEEKRSNLEVIKKQRDKYVREAIEEIRKKTPKDRFNEKNIENLKVEVDSILMEKHGDIDSGGVFAFGGDINSEEGRKDVHPLNRKDIDRTREFFGAYPDEVVSKLLKEAFGTK